MALASRSEDADFAPDPMSDMYRRGLHHAMIAQTEQALQTLRLKLRQLPESVQANAERLLEAAPALRRRFETLRDTRITAMRIRCHGDLHLEQALYTGQDFVIIDFEGEPARPLSERRIKRSPLRDAAGMLRSFQYASSYAGLMDQAAVMRSEDVPTLEGWAHYWLQWVSATYMRSYLAVAPLAQLLPPTRAETQLLLDVYMLDKAIHELLYELHHRPEWVRIPIESILQMVQPEE
ncbi:MAG: hypothetical protein NTZ05_03100 [Chloroflexi bacterium]|nr:hypothetical protein [Chloroflexota bacterium]